MKVRLKAGSARLWLVVTVLPVLLVVWTVIAVLVGPAGPHDPHRPDVDQLAASAPIASADSQASRSMAKLDRALAALPWLSREARSVDDACSSMAYGEFYRRFGPVGCSRTEWNYLAFDGDFLTHTQQINAALRAAGWNSPRGCPRSGRPTRRWATGPARAASSSRSRWSTCRPASTGPAHSDSR